MYRIDFSCVKQNLLHEYVHCVTFHAQEIGNDFVAIVKICCLKRMSKLWILILKEISGLVNLWEAIVCSRVGWVKIIIWCLSAFVKLPVLNQWVGKQGCWRVSQLDCVEKASFTWENLEGIIQLLSWTRKYTPKRFLLAWSMISKFTEGNYPQYRSMFWSPPFWF